MKKHLILCLAMLFAMTMVVSCEATGIYKHYCDYQKISMSAVWVDPETGVQYIIIDEFGLNGGIGITPRLDANGKIMVCKDMK